MDSVTLTLQNKELIEQIINSSNELRVKIPNAILDSITRRVVKTVNNSDSVNKAVDEAVNKAKDELYEKYFNKSKSTWGSPVWTMKPDFQQIIRSNVFNAFNDEVKKLIEKKTEQVTKMYEIRLKELYERTETALKKKEVYIDELIKQTVKDAVNKKFGV